MIYCGEFHLDFENSTEGSFSQDAYVAIYVDQRIIPSVAIGNNTHFQLIQSNQCFLSMYPPSDVVVL